MEHRGLEHSESIELGTKFFKFVLFEGPLLDPWEVFSSLKGFSWEEPGGWWKSDLTLGWWLEGDPSNSLDRR